MSSDMATVASPNVVTMRVLCGADVPSPGTNGCTLNESKTPFMTISFSCRLGTFVVGAFPAAAAAAGPSSMSV